MIVVMIKFCRSNNPEWCGEARSFIYFDSKTNKILLYWRMISNVRCLWWYVDTDVRTQWVKKKISLEIDMLTLVQTKQKERSVDRDKSLKMNVCVSVLLPPTYTKTNTHTNGERISLWHKLTHHKWVVLWDRFEGQICSLLLTLTSLHEMTTDKRLDDWNTKQMTDN